jgi:hypothetical protein
MQLSPIVEGSQCRGWIMNRLRSISHRVRFTSRAVIPPLVRVNPRRFHSMTFLQPMHDQPQFGLGRERASLPPLKNREDIGVDLRDADRPADEEPLGLVAVGLVEKGCNGRQKRLAQFSA